MSRTTSTLLLLALFGVLLTGVVAGTLSAMPDLPAATAHAAEAPAAPAVEVAAPVDAEAAFIADLFGPDTDVPAEQAAVLLELAHRYCVTVVAGQVPPGAEVPTREDWIATLTLPQPSLTTGWSLDEAEKFLDVAEASCSPGRV